MFAQVHLLVGPCITCLIAGPAELRKRTDAEIRHAAAKHQALKDSGCFSKQELDEFMKACGIKFPSEFSRLPYWDEATDYLIDLMHLIKNLGEHVLDTTMGVDFDNKTRKWAKARGIKESWWKTGMHPQYPPRPLTFKPWMDMAVYRHVGCHTCMYMAIPTL